MPAPMAMPKNRMKKEESEEATRRAPPLHAQPRDRNRSRAARASHE